MHVRNFVQPRNCRQEKRKMKQHSIIEIAQTTLTTASKLTLKQHTYWLKICCRFGRVSPYDIVVFQAIAPKT